MDLNFSGNNIQVAVIVSSHPQQTLGLQLTDRKQETSLGTLKWRGGLFYLFTGEHNFGFEPSNITPGGTAFVKSEMPERLNIILMPLLAVKKMFTSPCVHFKARVEILKAEGRLGAKETTASRSKRSVMTLAVSSWSHVQYEIVIPLRSKTLDRSFTTYNG